MGTVSYEVPSEGAAAGDGGEGSGPVWSQAASVFLQSEWRKEPERTREKEIVISEIIQLLIVIARVVIQFTYSLFIFSTFK